MNQTTTEPVVLKFEQLAEQTVSGITRISGFVRARHFVPVIDELDLEANPRSSKVGKVTAAIIESIQTTPEEFPFKTKGVLLGATSYERLDRGRIRIECRERDKEGILDGGHNTLAIGLHLLALAGVSDVKIRKARDWSAFRALWDAERETVAELRGRLSAFGTLEPGDDELAFLIPVELIVPSDPDDEGVVDAFQSSILEICAARNNNAELVVGAKVNKAGYFDDLRRMLPEGIADRIEWKAGEAAPVKAADLVALTWIPLSMLDPMPVDEGEKPVAAPIPQNLYRSKGECMQKFHDLMQFDAVTADHGGHAELRNPRVRSAFEVAAQMPALFDLISAKFPGAYNKNDGKYGRIAAVKKLNPENGKPRHAKFSGGKIDTSSPEGFLYPLVYGLIALMEQTPAGEVRWKTDPVSFLERNLVTIAEQYKDVISAFNWDPMKVGKAPLAYNVVKTAYANLLADEQAAVR